MTQVTSACPLMTADAIVIVTGSGQKSLEPDGSPPLLTESVCTPVPVVSTPSGESNNFSQFKDFMFLFLILCLCLLLHLILSVNPS